MRITFLGHACFSLQFNHARVLTDPYSPEIGYLPVDETPNLVTLSHQNPKWHSCLDDVRGEFEIFHGLERINMNTVTRNLWLSAVRVYENLQFQEGPNAMIKIQGGKIRLLHMGDCGHALDEATVRKCGSVDVLLAPAGGSPTIDLRDLKRFINELQPKIVIPMHFAVPGLGMKLRGVEDFVDLWPRDRVVNHNASSMEISRDSLPEQTQLHLLRPARLQPKTSD